MDLVPEECYFSWKFNCQAKKEPLISATAYSRTPEGEEQTNPKIERIPKDSPDVPYDVDIHRYQGPKQPPMPPGEATKAVCSLKSLAQQAVVVSRAWFSTAQNSMDTKHKKGELGHLPQAKTRVLYLPLIDMKPSDPDMMMTAMTRVQELTSKTGQDFSVLTCDQQLYWVAVQNVRALRMMAEEVLRSLITDGHFQKADDPRKALAQVDGKASSTCPKPFPPGATCHKTTFMRYGHSASGIIGITLKPEVLKICALNRHICCKIESDMKEMEEETNTSKVQLYHKEESKARLTAGTKDRAGLSESIMNITSGKIAPAPVNVDNAVQIGKTILADFEKTWPKGFYGTIPKQVKTMAITAKSIQVGDAKMYDLNVIYSRVIALFSSDRSVDVKNVLSHELAPVPTAMFTEVGMRLCKAKSTLKKSLQGEVSKRKAGDTDITVINGSALLWTIHWPADGNVADFINNVKARLTSYLLASDVYLIFDRYYDYCIKSITKDVRETVINKKHHFLL
ncbi:hypothetical protein ABVT39_013630 [Epinephelus coioides]